jgi:hypothetical protein
MKLFAFCFTPIERASNYIKGKHLGGTYQLWLVIEIFHNDWAGYFFKNWVVIRLSIFVVITIDYV